MRKLKIALLIVVMLLALVGWAAWNLNAYLERNKDDIAARITEQLGRPMRFDSVGVSLRGGLAIAVEGLEVADDPQYSEGNVFSADSLRVVVRLLPALMGRIEVRKIIVDQPRLAVVRTGTGLNTDVLLRGPTGTATPAREDAQENEQGAPAGSAESNGERPATAAPTIPPLDLLEIRDGRLRLVDRTRSPAVDVSLEHVNAGARSLTRDGVLTFDLHAALFAEEPNIVASGKLAAEPGAGLRAAIDAQVTALELERTASLLRSLGLLPNELSAAGPISLTVGFQTSSDGWYANARAGAGDAVITWGTAFAKPAGRDLTLDVEVIGSDAGVRFDNGRVQIGTLAAAWDATIQNSPRVAELGLRLEPTDLSELARMVPAIANLQPRGNMRADLRATWREAAQRELSGSITLDGVELSPPSGPAVSGITSTISIAGTRLAMPQTTIVVGKAPVAVFVSSEDFSARTFDFRLQAAMLDSSDFGGAPERLTLRDASLTGIVNIPAEGPLRMRARLAAASGKAAGVPFGATTAMLRLEGKRLIVNPLAGGLLGGSLLAEGVYDWSQGGAAAFNLQAKGGGIDLTALAEALGATPRLEGSLDADVTLAGTAGPWEQSRETLVGGGALTIRDGTLHGVNVASGVLHGIAALPGLNLLLSAPVLNQYPQLINRGETRFKELHARFTVAEGAILSDDITIGADDFTISGRGEIGLDGWTDIRATFEASVPLTSDLIDAVAPLRMLAAGTQRISIPFRLRGRPSDLSIKPDTTYVGRRVERGLIDLVTGGFLRNRNEEQAAPSTEQPPAGNAPAAADPPGTDAGGGPGTDAGSDPGTDTGSGPDATRAPQAPAGTTEKTPAERRKDPSVGEQILRGLGSLIGR
ncbi:MAG: AsmA family protein [Deltaproteobacteria bacterium]|nr:MAG: AsmA family protein [Deltaproteobacteria bacterium]